MPDLIQQTPKTLQDFENTAQVIDSCIWASKYPELQWTCSIHKISIDDPPIKCTYRQFRPLKQKGPTCGLVALSMLLNNDVKVEDLLKQANDKKYSINGEMFSVDYLLDLLDTNKTSDLKTWLHEGCLETVDVIEFLLNGGAMLVPYPFF